MIAVLTGAGYVIEGLAPLPNDPNVMGTLGLELQLRGGPPIIVPPLSDAAGYGTILRRAGGYGSGGGLFQVQDAVQLIGVGRELRTRHWTKWGAPIRREAH